MAGAIGHAVYGQRIALFLTNNIRNMPEFFAGTLFPNIRQLDIISRHDTHPTSVTQHSLLGNTDFSTGMRVHAWLDNTREEYLRNAQAAASIFWHPLVPYALRLLEDELLYDPSFNWDDIRRCLHTIYPIEQELIIDRSLIEKWHRLLRDYLAQAPSDTSRSIFGQGLGFSTALTTEINSVIDRLRQHQTTRSVLAGFTAHLDQLLL